MPELPEVETVCRGLEASLKNAIITKAEVHRSDLRIPFPKNLAERLKGKRIRGITRRAKYILIELDKNETLLLHLGMSGRMTISKTKSKPGKHDHLVFHFNNGLHVSFNDPRRFGMCDLVPTDKLDQHKLVKHLGVEPLCDDLTTDYLAAKFKGKKTSIKIAIMDQRLVVGVGNIYASEALFHAGINPKRLAGKVKRDEIAKLVPAIRKVLKAAIKAGGSSLRDYVQSDGELGYFQHQFSVYGKTSEKCRDCNCNTAKTGGIKQITQGGRSSFLLPYQAALGRLPIKEAWVKLQPMKKPLLLAILSLTFVAPSMAAQLNTKSNLTDTATGPAVGEVTTGFATAIEDLPLMPGLQVKLENDVIFVTPKSGRIAGTTAQGPVDVDEVYKFYKKTLPSLGWKPLSAKQYQREKEILNIEARADGKVTTVQFDVKPM